MGTSGVPWDVSKETIIASLKAQKGRLSYACKELGCTHTTLKKYIDADPELAELLRHLRNDFDCSLLDMAESSLVRGMKESDPNAYLKSAFYVLNHKGRSRGYLLPTEQLTEKDTILDDLKTGISELSQNSASETSSIAEMALEPPL